MGLLEIINKINKERKYEIITNGKVDLKIDKIPFTSPMLNYMTRGGIPRNHLIELAGEEGSGKTTISLDIVKNFQVVLSKEPEMKKVVFVDCENTFNTEWASLLGVDVDNLVLLTPRSESAEEIFEMILNLIQTGEVGLVVIDSLGVMISQQAYDKDVTEKTYGGISLALTLFSKKAVMECTRYKCTIVAINQVRMDLNSTYVPTLVTTGGKAWKHNTIMRMFFRKGPFIDNRNEEVSKAKASEPIGNVVEVSLEKIKSSKPDRRVGRFILNYSKGIDKINDLILLALKEEIITQKGAYYYFYEDDGTVSKFKDEELSFQGKNKLYKFISENEDFQKELEKILYEVIL